MRSFCIHIHSICIDDCGCCVVKRKKRKYRATGSASFILPGVRNTGQTGLAAGSRYPTGHPVLNTIYLWPPARRIGLPPMALMHLRSICVRGVLKNRIRHLIFSAVYGPVPRCELFRSTRALLLQMNLFDFFNNDESDDDDEIIRYHQERLQKEEVGDYYRKRGRFQKRQSS
jgi:hypothetical protein